MLGLLSQSSLILTTLSSFTIALLTFKSVVPDNRLKRIWVIFNCLVATWAMLWCAAAFYLTNAAARHWIMYLANYLAIALPPIFLSFVLTYLKKEIIWKTFLKSAWGFSGILFIAALVRSDLFVSGMQKIRDAYLPVAGVLLWVFAIQYTVLVVIGAVLLLLEIRNQSGAQRNKSIYILIGCALGFLGGSTTFPPALGIVKEYPYGVILVPLYSLLITYAILKHRLMDITIIIRKTIIYSAVMGTLTLSYLAIVALFARVFEGLTGYETIFSSAIAAGLITVGFQPLRKRVQTFVDGKFFRQYVDREEKLYELSREVITHTTPEAMAQSLIRVLSDTLHPKSAVLYLRSRDGNGFSLISEQNGKDLPSRMPDNNPLTAYFADHPQPFVQQDLPRDIGESLDTRRPQRKDDAA